jgi:hypothetical protein
MDATGKTPAQVQCRSCQGTHKYRPPKDAPKVEKATTKSSSSSKAAATKKAAASARSAAAATENTFKRWEELISRRAGTTEKAYNVTSAYGADDVVKHSQFGLGFVLEELNFNRVKVLFQDAERTLVVRHGQKPPAA